MQSNASPPFPSPPDGAFGWPWMGPSPRWPETMPDGSAWPKISVVTPNFNYARFIEATIRSVLLQGYPNLEYIVVDDGSTDGSRNIIRRYEPWIAKYIPQENRGQVAAINRGMRESTGGIMAWLNSDDMYMPWTFRTAAEIFTDLPEVRWLVGQNSWWDGDGRHIASKPVHKNVYNFLLGDFGWIQQESVFWRRGLWDEAGGALNEEYRFQMDGELWCRFFTHDTLWHADPVLAGFRHHFDNRSQRNWSATIADMERALARLAADVSPRVTRDARTLGRVRALKKALPWVNVDRLVRPLLRRLYREADHRRVSFIGGKWVANSSPFTTGAWRPEMENSYCRREHD